MAKIKTEKENLIDLRNIVSRRYIESIANAEYWKVVFKKAKKNTQDKVDAGNKAADNEKNAAKDKVFLSILDKMIK